MRIILVFIIYFFTGLSVAAEPLYAWVEMGPQSTVIARAIVSKKRSCPLISINEISYQMQLRSKADKEFPVHSCEYRIPRNADNAVIGSQTLALPPKRLQRIVIIGDTGCRLQDTQVQGCNNPQSWPFAEIAERVSELNPDLVIHVGDYHYRESPCPTWKKTCKGSPFGYGWKTWEADFFKPAEPLLAVAPWIMVRGNHEICSRAAKGWRRFLDPHPLRATCPDYTEPYAVKIADQRFIIFDSAAASLLVRPAQIKIYKKQFQTVNTLAEKKISTWLLLHHPIWALYKTQVGASLSNTASLQAAIGDGG
ncbi:MAG: metallophosphoesterase, partial [Gammaproteobacteria bacterium]